MKVLVACEESQEVCKAFRAKPEAKPRRVLQKQWLSSGGEQMKYKPGAYIISLSTT